MLLPAHSRVRTYRIANVVVVQKRNGQTRSFGLSIPIMPDTHIEAGPAGVLVETTRHDLAVYPPGTTLTIGGGEARSFQRPGERITNVSKEPAQHGCTVSYMNAPQEISHQAHYAQDCAALSLSRVLPERPR